MKELLISLFGTYTPVTTESIHYYTFNEEVYAETIDMVASGAAGLDWPWIMGVVLFAICLWSFFRLLGILLGGK